MNTLNADDIKKNASQVASGVEHAADSAKTSVVETLVKFGKIVAQVRGIDTDDVLGYAGLQRKSTLGSVGLFAAGLAVGGAIGAGAVLFFAPASGADMRKKVANAVKAFLDSDSVEEVESKAKSIAAKAKDKAHDLAGDVKDLAKDASSKAKDITADVKDAKNGEARQFNRS